MLTCKLIDIEQYKAEAQAQGMDRLWWHKLLKPGDMYYCSWYFDPGKDSREELWPSMYSKYYIEEYSKYRSPIIVVCPNGSTWMVDQKSNNGEGWQVAGEAPKITCTPSILVSGYHGFLTDGVFTDDLEGKKYLI